jgi:hypothetical protein
MRAAKSALCTILCEICNLFRATDIPIGFLTFLHSKLAEQTHSGKGLL